MEKEFPAKTWGYRHLIAVIAFLIFFQINIQRLSLAVAIVAMINHTSETLQTSHNSSISSCPFTHNSSSYTEEKKIQGEFDWNSDVLGYINGAAFFGMFLVLIPGSKLTQIFLSKRLILYSLIVSSIAVGISPFASRWHVYAFIAALFVRGCSEGIITLAFYVIMANWFPRAENGLLSTFALSGYSLGGILAGIIAGWICEDPRLGWTIVFYIVGGLGMLLAVLVLFALYESPNEHPRITNEELHRITDPMQVSVKKEPTPWLRIFSTTSTYAVMITFFGQFWLYAYFWSVNSTYLGTVLHLPINENGLFTSLPYLFKLIGENSASSFSHWLLRKGFMSIDTLRKVCTTAGSAGFSGAVLGIYFAGCRGFISSIFASVAMFFVGVSTPGAQITCMDMTKKFTGPLSGIMNVAGSTAAFIFPVVAGYLTPNKTLEEWHAVFFLSIAIVMTSAIIFAIFGSAEIQPWNFEQIEPETPKSLEPEQKHQVENTELHM